MKASQETLTNYRKAQLETECAKIEESLAAQDYALGLIRDFEQGTGRKVEVVAVDGPMMRALGGTNAVKLNGYMFVKTEMVIKAP